MRFQTQVCSCSPEKAISGTTSKSKLSKSLGSALDKTASARFKLLSTSATWGENCRQPILILNCGAVDDRGKRKEDVVRGTGHKWKVE